MNTEHETMNTEHETMNTTTSAARIRAHVEAHGPIPAVRVSSAGVRGRARGYYYVGAALYTIELTRAGEPRARCESRANGAIRARRSLDLAHRDAAETGRCLIASAPGRLRSEDLERVCAWLDAHAEAHAEAQTEAQAKAQTEVQP